MLWFNRVGIGLAILVTAGSGLLYFETRHEVIAERAEITTSNAGVAARNNNCHQTKKLKPGANVSDEDLLCAFAQGDETPEKLPPIPTMQDASHSWLSAMAWVVGIWFLLAVLDFMAGGNERRAKSKSVG